MLENWAKLSGLAAILAAVLSVSFLWALNYVPPQNAEWTCEAKADPNEPNKPALQTFSCHTKQTENLESQATRAKEKGNQESTSGIKITDVLLALFTAMLVIVTAVLGVVGIGQGYELRRAVNASREEFLASHRPKIRIKHLWLTNDISQGESIKVKMVCVNTGTTDAERGQLGIQCHVVGNEYLLPVNPSIAAYGAFPRDPLPPGLNWTIPDMRPDSFIDTGRILAAHEWAAIQTRHAKLYCVGWISYRDDALRLRITGFCRVLEPPDANTVLTSANGRFRICKHPDYEYQD